MKVTDQLISGDKISHREERGSSSGLSAVHVTSLSRKAGDSNSSLLV